MRSREQRAEGGPIYITASKRPIPPACDHPAVVKCLVGLAPSFYFPIHSKWPGAAPK
jgi:hypothetical protein